MAAREEEEARSRSLFPGRLCCRTEVDSFKGKGGDKVSARGDRTKRRERKGEGWRDREGEKQLYNTS